MKVEIKVPDLPESVSDALVLSWYKKAGDAVQMDDVLLELETDKVVLEVPAPESGVLSEIRVEEGETVNEGMVLAVLDTAAKSKGSTPQGSLDKKAETEKNPPQQKVKTAKMVKPQADDKALPSMSPSVRRLIEEHQLDPLQIEGTGKHGRIVKDDVLAFIEKQNQRKLDEIRQSSRFEPARDNTSHQPVKPSPKSNEVETLRDLSGREQKRVPMTRLRARIAERLLSVSQTTAMLTTFNEVDLSKVIQLRKDYQQMFVQTFDIKLGYMSLFVKATCEALKRFPDVNASIDGDEIVYHGFCDIGVAVSTDRGLVVPILRDAEQMSLSEIEKNIKELADKARNNHLTMDDIKGGTFTITNGGVFGSMLSTPILNPPQSAILGMHAIKERPVAENGQVVIRPMMYLALSYDHRIIDGKSAVQFLKTIKDLLEDPARILLDV